MAGRAHVIHIHHTPPPRENRPYFKLSAHYKWALNQVTLLLVVVVLGGAPWCWWMVVVMLTALLNFSLKMLQSHHVDGDRPKCRRMPSRRGRTFDEIAWGCRVGVRPKKIGS